MNFKRPTSEILPSSIWNNKCERAPVPKPILRSSSSRKSAHSSSKKNVHFRDRDRHTSCFGPSLFPSDGEVDDQFLSKEYVIPIAKKIDGSHRPSRRLRFSSLVYGDSGSTRARYANARKGIDSIWSTNHRAEPSWPLPSEDLPDDCFPPPETFNLLFHRPITRMELRWDLVKPLSMSKINNWLNCIPFLDEPALGSDVISAQIHFRESRLWRLEHLWGPIVVRAKGPDQPMTLRHLLDEIFDYFQHPIKDISYAADAAAIRAEDIVDSWRQRNYNTYQPGYKCTPYLHDRFIRRVDFLLGFSLFRKLRLVSVSGQSCDLVLSIR